MKGQMRKVPLHIIKYENILLIWFFLKNIRDTIIFAELYRQSHTKLCENDVDVMTRAVSCNDTGNRWSHTNIV